MVSARSRSKKQSRISYFPPHSSVIRARIPTPRDQNKPSISPEEEAADFDLARARFLGASALAKKGCKSRVCPSWRKRMACRLPALNFLSSSSLHLGDTIDRRFSSFDRSISHSDKESCKNEESEQKRPQMKIEVGSAGKIDLEREANSFNSSSRGYEDDFDTEEAIARVTRVIESTAAEITALKAAEAAAAASADASTSKPGLWRRLSQRSQRSQYEAEGRHTNPISKPPSLQLHLQIPSPTTITASKETSELVTIPLASPEGVGDAILSLYSVGNNKSVPFSPINGNTICDEDYLCIDTLPHKENGKVKTTERNFAQRASESLKRRRKSKVCGSPLLSEPSSPIQDRDEQMSGGIFSDSPATSKQQEVKSSENQLVELVSSKKKKQSRVPRLNLFSRVRSRIYEYRALISTAATNRRAAKSRRVTKDEYLEQLEELGKVAEHIKSHDSKKRPYFEDDLKNILACKNKLLNTQDSEQKRLVFDTAKMQADDWVMISPGTQSTYVDSPLSPILKIPSALAKEPLRALSPVSRELISSEPIPHPSPSSTVRFNNVMQIRPIDAPSASEDQFVMLGTSVVERSSPFAAVSPRNPFSPRLPSEINSSPLASPLI